jgi:hypothetical protein
VGLGEVLLLYAVLPSAVVVDIAMAVEATAREGLQRQLLGGRVGVEASVVAAKTRVSSAAAEGDCECGGEGGDSDRLSRVLARRRPHLVESGLVLHGDRPSTAEALLHYYYHTQRRRRRPHWLVERLLLLSARAQFALVRGSLSALLVALVYLWSVARGRRETLTTSAFLFVLSGVLLGTFLGCARRLRTPVATVPTAVSAVSLVDTAPSMARDPPCVIPCDVRAAAATAPHRSYSDNVVFPVVLNEDGDLSRSSVFHTSLIRSERVAIDIAPSPSPSLSPSVSPSRSPSRSPSVSLSDGSLGRLFSSDDSDNDNDSDVDIVAEDDNSSSSSSSSHSSEWNLSLSSADHSDEAKDS